MVSDKKMTFGKRETIGGGDGCLDGIIRNRKLLEPYRGYSDSFPVSERDRLWIQGVFSGLGDPASFVLWDRDEDILEFLYLDSRLDPKYRRFVIGPGIGLHEAEEHGLDQLCKSGRAAGVFPEKRLLHMLQTEYGDRHPELHLGETDLNSYDNLFQMTAHIFYALNTRGRKELFYKAGLPRCALMLDQIEEMNLIATTPEECLELPVKCLRAVTYTMRGISCIRTAKDRDWMRGFFRKNGFLFEEYGHFSESQIRFLEWLKTPQAESVQIRNLRVIFRYLENRTPEQTERYLRYLENRIVAGAYCRLPLIPSGEMEEYDFQKAAGIADLLSNRSDVWIKMVALRYADLNWLGEGGLQVVVPQTLDQFICAAESLGNCLWMPDMIRNVENSVSLVLFIYQDAKLIGAIEVDPGNGTIIQLRGQENRQDWTEEQWDFLKRYMEKKHLVNLDIED